MRMHKRGSLSLSVNAIVVFILAFGMLGVGLFFINKVRTSMDIDPEEFIPGDMMSNPPTSEAPLTVDGKPRMKRNGQLETNIGFYNKDPDDVTGVRFFIIECISTSTGNAIKRPDITTTNTLDLTPISCKQENGAPCEEQPPEGWKLPRIVTATTMQFPSGEGKGPPATINADGALEVGKHMCALAAVIQESEQNKVKGTTSFQIEILP